MTNPERQLRLYKIMLQNWEERKKEYCKVSQDCEAALECLRATEGALNIKSKQDCIVNNICNIDNSNSRDMSLAMNKVTTYCRDFPSTRAVTPPLTPAPAVDPPSTQTRSPLRGVSSRNGRPGLRRFHSSDTSYRSGSRSLLLKLKRRL